MNINRIVLNESQKSIMKLQSGKHCVLAPPGTGKTELLNERINFALKKSFIPTIRCAL